MNEWKEIKDFEGLYEVSIYGEVRRIAYDDVQSKAKFELPYILKPSKERFNYLKVTLFKNGKPKIISIHRLVAKTFINNPENKLQVNHIDGNGNNNYYKNLEWCTMSENIIHRINYLNPKFTEKIVKQYDLNNKFIKKYKSCAEAGRQNNICGISVARCARGERTQYKSFIRKYE
jgi:predicted nucleic acid-binding OB-fold protein